MSVSKKETKRVTVQTLHAMKAKGEKPFSVEICGGPHVNNTRELAEGGKKFKIQLIVFFLETQPLI